MTRNEASQCSECDGFVRVPQDPMEGEIVSCADCGTSYELMVGRDGTFSLNLAEVEGEDWGE